MVNVWYWSTKWLLDLDEILTSIECRWRRHPASTKRLSCLLCLFQRCPRYGSSGSSLNYLRWALQQCPTRQLRSPRCFLPSLRAIYFNSGVDLKTGFLDSITASSKVSLLTGMYSCIDWIQPLHPSLISSNKDLPCTLGSKGTSTATSTSSARCSRSFKLRQGRRLYQVHF